VLVNNWQGDHAFDAVFFQQVFTDFAFVIGVGTHRAVGQQQRHAAVAGRRDAVLPVRVVVFDAGVPFLHIEWRIGHHEVRAQVWVFIVAEGVGRFAAKIEVDAAIAMFIAAKCQVVVLDYWP